MCFIEMCFIEILWTTISNDFYLSIMTWVIRFAEGSKLYDIIRTIMKISIKYEDTRIFEKCIQISGCCYLENKIFTNYLLEVDINRFKSLFNVISNNAPSSHTILIIFRRLINNGGIKPNNKQHLKMLFIIKNIEYSELSLEFIDFIIKNRYYKHLLLYIKISRRYDLVRFDEIYGDFHFYGYPKKKNAVKWTKLHYNIGRGTLHPYQRYI